MGDHLHKGLKMAIELLPSDLEEVKGVSYYRSWREATDTHFSIVPNGFLRWGIDPHRKAVLGALISWADRNTGRVSRRLHQRDIMDWSGMSLRQVQTTLAKLEKQELIKVTRSPARASEYVVMLDEIATLLPEPPRKEPKTSATKAVARKVVASTPTTAPVPAAAPVSEALPPVLASDVRPNKYGQECCLCSKPVLPYEGRLIGKKAAHLDCDAWKRANRKKRPGEHDKPIDNAAQAATAELYLERATALARKNRLEREAAR